MAPVLGCSVRSSRRIRPADSVVRLTRRVTHRLARSLHEAPSLLRRRRKPDGLRKRPLRRPRPPRAPQALGDAVMQLAPLGQPLKRLAQPGLALPQPDAPEVHPSERVEVRSIVWFPPQRMPINASARDSSMP